MFEIIKNLQFQQILLYFWDTLYNYIFIEVTEMRFKKFILLFF